MQSPKARRVLHAWRQKSRVSLSQSVVSQFSSVRQAGQRQRRFQSVGHGVCGRADAVSAISLEPNCASSWPSLSRMKLIRRMHSIPHTPACRAGGRFDAGTGGRASLAPGSGRACCVLHFSFQILNLYDPRAMPSPHQGREGPLVGVPARPAVRIG